MTIGEMCLPIDALNSREMAGEIMKKGKVLVYHKASCVCGARGDRTDKISHHRLQCGMIDLFFVNCGLRGVSLFGPEICVHFRYYVNKVNRFDFADRRLCPFPVLRFTTLTLWTRDCVCFRVLEFITLTAWTGDCV